LHSFSHFEIIITLYLVKWAIMLSSVVYSGYISQVLFSVGVYNDHLSSIKLFNIAGDGISVTYICFHADKCLLYIILITHLIIIHLWEWKCKCRFICYTTGDRLTFKIYFRYDLHTLLIWPRCMSDNRIAVACVWRYCGLFKRIFMNPS
jgi:hypothetical protein